MPTAYHVYTNDGRGGPIDYDRPIATVPAPSAGSVAPLTFAVGPLTWPSDNLFAVRAFDDTSGIEEANTDARTRLILDEAGADITARPNPVLGLAARWSAGGLALVSWGYRAEGQGGPPVRFDVFVTPEGAGSDVFGSPAQSIPYVPGGAGFGCRLAELGGDSAQVVLVRAIGATGIASPLASARLPRPVVSLSAVDGLQAVATP